MSRPLRVLIVEDSMPDAELLLYELRQGGYEPAHEVVDTAEAMNSSLDRQDWEVVLSDYVMPGFGGLAALKLLKARGLDLPFIIVSGAIGEETAVAAMKAGAHDYLMKDSLARLVPAVERELGDAEDRRRRRQAEEERDQLMEQLRKVNEQAVVSSLRMKEQAAQLEAVVEALAEAMVVCGPAGEILQANPVAAGLLGVSKDRKASMTELWALLRPQTEEGEPFPAGDAPHLRALRGQTVRGVVALLHRSSDGKTVRVSASAAPVRNPAGKPQGAAIIFTDITPVEERRGAAGQRV